MAIMFRTSQLSSSLRSRPLMKVGIRAGTSVIERIATPIMAKLLVKAKGWNVLPSCPVKANTGTNDKRMIITEKKIGRPTMRQAGMTISRVSPVIFLCGGRNGPSGGAWRFPPSRWPGPPGCRWRWRCPRAT